MQQAIRIIGIDPGLRRTGWGVVESLGNSLRFIAAGTVKSDDKAPLAYRLRQLHDGLREVMARQAPSEAAVEQTFVNKDAVATLKLGQARGAVMLVPALAGLPVAEYAPNAVKKSVIGVGHGTKRDGAQAQGVRAIDLDGELHLTEGPAGIRAVNDPRPSVVGEATIFSSARTR